MASAADGPVDNADHALCVLALELHQEPREGVHDLSTHHGNRNGGSFCALDFVLFFVFWSDAIPMALLIGIWAAAKIYASLKFFIYTMSGSVFLLVRSSHCF